MLFHRSAPCKAEGPPLTVGHIATQLRLLSARPDAAVDLQAPHALGGARPSPPGCFPLYRRRPGRHGRKPRPRKPRRRTPAIRRLSLFSAICPSFRRSSRQPPRLRAQPPVPSADLPAASSFPARHQPESKPSSLPRPQDLSVRSFAKARALVRKLGLRSEARPLHPRTFLRCCHFSRRSAAPNTRTQQPAQYEFAEWALSPARPRDIPRNPVVKYGNDFVSWAGAPPAAPASRRSRQHRRRRRDRRSRSAPHRSDPRLPRARKGPAKLPGDAGEGRPRPLPRRQGPGSLFLPLLPAPALGPSRPRPPPAQPYDDDAGREPRLPARPPRLAGAGSRPQRPAGVGALAGGERGPRGAIAAAAAGRGVRAGGEPPPDTSAGHARVICLDAGGDVSVVYGAAWAGAALASPCTRAPR